MEPDNAALDKAQATEDFVAGRLSETDRAAFEERLRTDLALRTAVEAERLIQQASGLEHVAIFKQVLADVAAQVEGEVRASGGGRVLPIAGTASWTWWAAAASVALVLSVGVTQWMSGPSGSELALAYAEGSYSTTRGEDGPEPYTAAPELNAALAHIIAERPDQALSLLNTYQPTEPAMICKHDWLSALALLQKDQKDKAVALLDKVVAARCYPEEGTAKELKSKL